MHTRVRNLASSEVFREECDALMFWIDYSGKQVAYG